MLTTLKIELLETSKEHVSINLIVCKNNLIGAKDSDGGSPVSQPKFWTQEHRDGWPRTLAQEDCDVWSRTVAKFDSGSPGRQSKHWAHEHTDGLFVKLKRERAELRDGLPGKIEKAVTDEQKTS